MADTGHQVKLWGFSIELARKDLALAAGHGHDDVAAVDYQRRPAH